MAISMKRTIYLGVITLITIGCVLYGVNGWFGGNRNFFSFGNEQQYRYSIQENTTLEPFHSIAVDAVVMDMTIIEGTDRCARVTEHNADAFTFQAFDHCLCAVEHGTALLSNDVQVVC